MFFTWSSNVETDIGFQANEDNKSCGQKNKKTKRSFKQRRTAVKQDHGGVGEEGLPLDSARGLGAFRKRVIPA